MEHDLPLITTIAAAFGAAWVLGIITHKLRLSPIVGYLLAGIVIGPYTPGFSGDMHLAQQLAELGVILLMFGVGLHFHLGDLLRVRNVAVPGAIGQSLVATILGAAMAWCFGWEIRHGLVLGMAMAVASTVVLVRVLTDNRLLDSTHGHVAVGWLVVEDILTIIVLVLIPALGTTPGAGDGEVAAAATSLGKSLLIAMLKLGALVAIVLLAGSRVVPWLMVRVARLRSRELFTLTVLMLAIVIAAGSSYVFGASMALGAFLAGMVVGQSPVSQQAAADALPLRDAFAVLFFTSVGMLFDPRFVIDHPGLLLAGLGIVLIGKPLAALVIVAVIGYPVRTALIVALGLAQIGEFSFILAELGMKHALLDEEQRNMLIAVALVTISLNPILFRLERPLETRLRQMPRLWRLLNFRAARREQEINAGASERIERSDKPLAVILGYGPVGRTVDELLRSSELDTVVVDLNMDTIQSLTKQGRTAIYGDAYNIEVLYQALPNAKYVVITLPHAANRGPLIASVKLINPEIKIFVRARYVAERTELIQTGADAAVFEEAEVAVALARTVLSERGADDRAIVRETSRIRKQLRAESPELR